MYGTLIRFSGGAKTATISQFRTNRPIRIVMKRRGLHGIIGCFFGAPLTRRLPRCGSGGGGAVRGSGARVSSSAMAQCYVGRARQLRAPARLRVYRRPMRRLTSLIVVLTAAGRGPGRPRRRAEALPRRAERKGHGRCDEVAGGPARTGVVPGDRDGDQAHHVRVRGGARSGSRLPHRPVQQRALQGAPDPPALLLQARHERGVDSGPELRRPSARPEHVRVCPRTQEPGVPLRALGAERRSYRGSS